MGLLWLLVAHFLLVSRFFQASDSIPTEALRDGVGSGRGKLLSRGSHTVAPGGWEVTSSLGWGSAILGSMEGAHSTGDLLSRGVAGFVVQPLTCGHLKTAWLEVNTFV